LANAGYCVALLASAALIVLAIFGQVRQDAFYWGHNHGKSLFMSGNGVVIIEMEFHSFKSGMTDPTFWMHPASSVDWSTFVSWTSSFRDLDYNSATSPRGLDAFKLRQDNRFGIHSMSVMLPSWLPGIVGLIALPIIGIFYRRRLRNHFRRDSAGFPCLMDKPQLPAQ